MNLIPRSNNFFLEDVFGDFLSKDTNNFICDIYEKEGKYFIEMDTSGFTKEDIKIESDRGYLTVSVSKNNEINEEEKNYIRRERSTRQISRSFYVGDVDTESIKASFNNGVLVIEVPKEEKIDSKRIKQIEE